MQQPNGYAKPAALVSTAWVAEHLDDQGLQLVEVDVDTAEYGNGHIHGAFGWDWKVDLQRGMQRDIPSREEWEILLRASGVGNETHVVLYGDNSNWFAAFAYWLFKIYGHDKVSLMNGGRKLWIDEQRPMTTEVILPVNTSYHAREADQSLRAYRDQISMAIASNDIGLVDVRSPGEFTGELLAPAHLPQEGAQRGGHVPGAQNVPWGTAVNEDGTFKSAEDLTGIYGSKGITDDKATIAYCRIGERSAHTWYVLTELLGFPHVRNYDGSWTEWGSLVGVPIER